MRKITLSTAALALCLSLTLNVSVALAALQYADSAESFSQGLRKNGTAVLPERSDPTKALGAPDNVFVSLGYGGQLVVKFAAQAGGSVTVGVQEITGGTYPLETATVEVSLDGSSWTELGEASNENGQGDGLSTFDLQDTCIQYVRLTDTTNSALHDATSDAFDVDAVSADNEGNCPEPPQEEDDCCGSGPIVVINKNTAVVGNDVSSRADTGDNYAGGSEGGNGGDAGDIENDGGVGVINGGTTGNGGRGGDGDAGGIVVTGSATSGARAINVVNTNITRVGPDEGEQADCCPAGPVVASNRNRAIVFNGVEAKADTGDNAAKGSEGGNAGDAGDIENETGNEASGTIVNSTTGNGGQGGAGDAGGYIETGSAVSGSHALTIVNTNRLRVR